MGRREEKREATRQEILSAASELFKTKGYEATSVDDIVVSANVAKGTFYYHFAGKEELIFALQEGLLKVAADNARASMKAGKSPRQVLFEFISEAAHWTEENPELARAMHKQKFAQMQAESEHGCPAQAGPPPAVKLHFFSVITEIIAAAQTAGEFRQDSSPEQIARVIIPVVMFARMSWLTEQNAEPLSARLESSIKILLDGLKP